MTRKYYYCLLILFVVVSACKKDNNPQVFTSNSYPLAVGDWWQYQLLDIFGGGGYDTFTVNVVSMTNMAPYMEYKCNVVVNGAVWDSGYFLQSDTSLAFVNSMQSYFLFPNFHFKFPAKTGDKWLGTFAGDTIKVNSVVSSYQAAPGYTYGPCYFLSEDYDLPHNSKAEGLILTPKIGLIHQFINFNSDTAGGQIQQSILLINYHVQ